MAKKLVKQLTQYADQTTPEPVITQSWAGVIGVESELTGDGRLIEADALEWETPIPLRIVIEDTGAHEGAVTVGRILTIERREGGQIYATGDFDHGSEVGREAARLVTEEVLNGISMDLDSVAFEIRVARELYDEVMGELDETLEDGDELAAEEVPDLKTDEDGRVIVAEMSPDQEIMVTTSARIRAATLVSIPAFAGAKIHPYEQAVIEADGLVASAAPIEPPQEWFYKPEADGPTALTITDDGQVYGHLATWDTCHVADPSGAGICVMAPKNTSGYKYFHTGAVKTAEGTLVPTGSIRFNTSHASMQSNAASASAHYDNTGLAGADVHAVDGKHGIWIAGALRPNVTAEQIRILRASPLSGDWRFVGGNLELVGALAVNLPGFPIPRTQGLVASGSLNAIVAAGMVAPEAAKFVKQFSDNDAAYLQSLIDRERLHKQREFAQRVESARKRQKIHSFAVKQKLVK